MNEVTHMLPHGPHEIINSTLVEYHVPETPEERELRIAQGKPAPMIAYRASNVRQIPKAGS